ncbi:MAG: PLP-dependent transferase, partial [Pyrinomonadaceae bacterium]
RAVSLGTCDTLISHPASMTHYGIPKEKREEYGIQKIGRVWLYQNPVKKRKWIRPITLEKSAKFS